MYMTPLFLASNYKINKHTILKAKPIFKTQTLWILNSQTYLFLSMWKSMCGQKIIYIIIMYIVFGKKYNSSYMSNRIMRISNMWSFLLGTNSMI